MGTINYNGMELEEFKSDKPVIFDPPEECICWDDEKDADYHNKDDDFVLAYIPLAREPFITKGGAWYHGAILPKKPAPRRVTHYELAKWLATGNGQLKVECYVYPFYPYGRRENEIYTEVPYYYKVRKWDDTEWHEPTADYLGLED